MSQVYTLPGAVRWRSHDGRKDVRSHLVPGWRVEPMELTHHPITGRRFRGGVCQWWFKETKVGTNDADDAQSAAATEGTP